MPDANEIILLVEDTEDDVFLMKRALKVSQIFNPLRVAEDGEQAINYLDGKGKFSDRALHPYPKYIFLDLKLPLKSGFDVLQWINDKGSFSRPLIFILTSSNLPSDMEEAASLGSDSYLVKPPTPDTFRELAEQFGIEWQRAPSQGREVTA